MNGWNDWNDGSTFYYALLFPVNSPKTRQMKIVRLYTGSDNESHFEEIDVELNLRGHMEVSELQPAHGMLFRRVPALDSTVKKEWPYQRIVILAGSAAATELMNKTETTRATRDRIIATLL